MTNQQDRDDRLDHILDALEEEDAERERRQEEDDAYEDEEDYRSWRAGELAREYRNS